MLNKNRSVVYQFSSPTNLQPVNLPYRVQIVQLAVSQTHFVALTSGKFQIRDINNNSGEYTVDFIFVYMISNRQYLFNIQITFFRVRAYFYYVIYFITNKKYY